MTPAEVQTFLITFGFLFGAGLVGWLWAARAQRKRALEAGEVAEQTGRFATSALIVAAILLDAVLAMVVVLLGRQNS